MASGKVWWYSKGEQRLGPYTAAELKERVASGQVTSTDMVWKEGLPNWVQASSVSGLFTTNGSESPPPLPPTQAGSAQKLKIHGSLRVAFWAIGVFVVLIIFATIFGPSHNRSSNSGQVASSSPNHAEAASASASTSAPPTLKVGDTFETPKFQMRIVSVQLRHSVGGSVFGSKINQGGVFVAILWSYKNISKKPVSPFDLPTLHLVAPDGTNYDPDIGASASYATEVNTNPMVLSDLNPGIQVTDAEVFEVSQEQFNPASWKIVVDADENAEIAFATSGMSGTSGAANSDASGNPVTTGLPQFQKGESYADVRTKLLKAGWQPFHSSDAEACEEGDPRCQGRPEMESCAGTGLANCKFLWKKQDKVLAICTVGEEIAVFDSVCSYP
jgi:hypothetical protein